MIYAHKVETVLTENGTLVLQGLPFQAGESVEVIVLGQESVKVAQPIVVALPKAVENAHPLKGSVYFYDDPFGPATPLEDWEVLQ